MPRFAVIWNKTEGVSIFFSASDSEDELCTSSAQLVDLAISKFQTLNSEDLQVSPLRNLLDELKIVTKRCASKNRWPVPTGVNKLFNLLKSLDWKKDEELPQLLKRCHQVIAERFIKYSYLRRDAFTYFFYRNFYSILKEISEESFETICEKINLLRELALQKCKATNHTFTHLYWYLLEIKGRLDSEQWNNKGKTLGIFTNKPPDGICRLRKSFNKFPKNLFVKDEDQIQLIKVFMQIKDVLAEKVLYSGERTFRATEVSEFYKDLHRKIQTIYSALSQEDKEVFYIVQGEANNTEAREMLAIPKGYPLLSNPENILKLFELIAEPTKPGCSHCT